MSITEVVDNYGEVPAMPIAVGEDSYLPSMFWAEIDDPSLDFIVALQIHVRGGRASGVRIVQVNYGGRIPTASQMKQDGLWPALAITPKNVRKVRLGEYLELALISARRSRHNHGDGTFSTDEKDSERFSGPMVGAVAPGRGKPMGIEFLRDVAETYREAVASGDRAPVEAVARRFHGSRSSAGRWVGQARDEHLLGPAVGTRAGERASGRRRKQR